MAPMRTIRFCCSILVCFLFSSPCVASFTLFIKQAPASAVLEADGEAVPVQSIHNGFRQYRIPGSTPETLLLRADGYRSKLLAHPVLPPRVEDGEYCDVKLESLDSALSLDGYLETGSQPKSVLFVEGGQRLAVALLNGEGIEVFDLERRERCASSSPPEEDAEKLGFVEMAELKSRNELWVSQMTTGKIHIFELGSYRYKRSVSSGDSWPKVLCPNQDESLVYVSHWLGKSICEIDSETGRVLRSFPVPGIPRGMALSRDERYLYVANFSSGDIERIDLRDGERTSWSTGPGAMRHLVYDGRTQRLYFSDMYHGSVGALSTKDGRVLWRRRVGANVNTIDIDKQRNLLCVSCRGRNGSRGYLYEGEEFGQLVLLRLSNGDITERIWGGDQPTGLDLSPSGRYLAFSDFLDHRVELYRF